MEVIEAIKKRQSIRKYQDKAVSGDILTELIDAARLAPSGCNTQAWAYKIVASKDEIKGLKKNNIFPQDFVYTAPAIIFCCYDASFYNDEKSVEDNPRLGTEPTLRAVRDLGIASSYLMLRAEELGLGTCYIGLVDKDKSKEILRIPGEMEVLFAITVGHSDEMPSRSPRKEIKEILIN